MQARAGGGRAPALRPHVKTHKSPDLARLQAARGAAGLTVATLDEAEAFAAAGFSGPPAGDARRRAGQARAASRRSSTAAPASRSPSTRRRASASRSGRWGAGPSPSRSWSRWTRGTAGAACRGTTGPTSPRSPARVRQSELAPARRAPHARGPRLRRPGRGGGPGGRAPPGRPTPSATGSSTPRARPRARRPPRPRATAELSLGSTPGLRHFTAAERDGFRVTEVRPGTYVFHDATQVALGAADAPTVRARLRRDRAVSKRRAEDGTERVITDAGKKVLTSDTGLGRRRLRRRSSTARAP